MQLVAGARLISRWLCLEGTAECGGSEGDLTLGYGDFDFRGGGARDSEARATW